jgi:hypothetical protein
VPMTHCAVRYQRACGPPFITSIHDVDGPRQGVVACCLLEGDPVGLEMLSQATTPSAPSDMRASPEGRAAAKIVGGFIGEAPLRREGNPTLAHH